MGKAYCIDTSGSVTTDQIAKAIEFVRKGIEPADLVFAVDCNIVRMIDVRNEQPAIIMAPDLRGGFAYLRASSTDPHSSHPIFIVPSALIRTFAKQHGADFLIFISDGQMSDWYLSQFNKHIDINTL